MCSLKFFSFAGFILKEFHKEIIKKKNENGIKTVEKANRHHIKSKKCIRNELYEGIHSCLMSQVSLIVITCFDKAIKMLVSYFA